MQVRDNTRNGIHHLRRTMRDLVAFSMLPAVWTDYDPPRIAGSLADVLLHTLPLDLIYIQARDQSGQNTLQLARSAASPGGQDETQQIISALAPWLQSDAPRQPPSIPHPLRDETLCLAVIHFEYGRETGGLVAASRRPDFPNDSDCLLLRVGANHAAVLMQCKWAEEALREADRRKDEFLGTLAHELRNPLAAIHNALQVMHILGDSGSALEQISRPMERQVKQLVRLVDDLVSASRITRNTLELRKERIELAAAIRSAVEPVRPLIEEAGQQFTVTLPPNPVLLNADLVRLAQVFSNLLNNATKYTERDGHIWLSAEQYGGEVVVRVRDTGIGIPASMLSKVFELFVQVDRSLERRHGGLGIGLTMVQRLIEMHDGVVEARSDGPGQGSEFIVRLPVAQPLAEEPQSPAGDNPQGMDSVKRRVLVADDNRDVARVLSMLLRTLGNEVCTAYDGFEAVEAAANFRPDVILLDIGMPNLNGYDAARQIRMQAWGKDILLVALTGWGQDEDKHRSREAGFDYHLTKPVEVDDLKKLLSEC